jgi:hypothetical protein
MVHHTKRLMIPDRIERHDGEPLAGSQEGDVAIRTVTTPNNGERPVAVRRL